MIAVQADEDRPAPGPILAGKIVMVSGVGPDLGRSLAVRSALAGADVVLAARSSERLEKIAAEVAELGRRALSVPTDVGDAVARSRLVAAALAEFGGVDVLLNSAFVQPRQEPLLEADLATMQSQSSLNVLASVGLVKELAPTLCQRRGSVVLVNSMVIRNRLPNFGAYRMDKAALLAAARSLSIELGPRGVRVNSVVPGYIWADKVRGHLHRQAERGGVAFEELYSKMVTGVDLQRFPTPDEIADAALFLASDLASGVTGQCIDVNCGQAHD